MAKRELLRDYVAGDLDPDLVRQRQSAGWRLAPSNGTRLGGTIPGRPHRGPYGMRVDAMSSPRRRSGRERYPPHRNEDGNSRPGRCPKLPTN